MSKLVPVDQEIAALQERVRFYISTPERAAEALSFVKQLKDFSEAI